jgi:hypothetical protein
LQGHHSHTPPHHHLQHRGPFPHQFRYLLHSVLRPFTLPTLLDLPALPNLLRPPVEPACCAVCVCYGREPRLERRVPTSKSTIPPSTTANVPSRPHPLPHFIIRNSRVETTLLLSTYQFLLQLLFPPPFCNRNGRYETNAAGRLTSDSFCCSGRGANKEIDFRAEIDLALSFDLESPARESVSGDISFLLLFVCFASPSGFAESTRS